MRRKRKNTEVIKYPPENLRTQSNLQNMYKFIILKQSLKLTIGKEKKRKEKKE